MIERACGVAARLLVFALCGSLSACDRASPAKHDALSAGSAAGVARAEHRNSEATPFREERYSLRADFLAEVGAAPTTTIHLEGELGVSTQSGAPLRRRFLLARASGSGRQGDQETWKPAPAELETPFYVEYDARGVATHISMAPEASVQVRRSFETLAAAIQVAGDPGAKARWESQETDNIGTYVAVYERAEPGRVTKRKSRYESTPGTLGQARSGLEIVKSETQIAFGKQGELLGVKGNDVVSVRQLQVRSGVDFELRDRSLHRPDSRVDPPAPPASYVRYAIGKASEYSERERDQALVAGLSLDGVLADPKPSTEAGKRAELRQRLAALVRLEAAAADEIAAAARNDSPRTQDLIGGLVLAGTPEAQRALLAVVTDASRDAPVREHAAIFSGQVKKPTEALLLGLFQEFEKPDSSVRQVAGYAAGTLAGVLEDQPVAETIVTRSMQRFTAAKDADERQLLLGMLGNAGMKSSLPVLLDAARSPNDAERAQAVRCVRGIDTPETRALVSKALGDASVPVRLAALESIKKLGVADYRAELARAVRRERDERVQLQMLGELGAQPPTPEVLAALDWVAKSAKSKRAQEFAQKIRTTARAAATARHRLSKSKQNDVEPKG